MTDDSNPAADWPSGICRQCRCQWNTPCTEASGGECSWADDWETLCSACVNASFATEIERQGDGYVLTVMRSLDEGPAKMFEPLYQVPLDIGHVTQLIGTAALATREEAEKRAAACGED